MKKIPKITKSAGNLFEVFEHCFREAWKKTGQQVSGYEQP